MSELLKISYLFVVLYLRVDTSFSKTHAIKICRQSRIT